MIQALLNTTETTPLPEVCARLGQVLGLEKPVPQAVLLRAIDDPAFAADLITCRNAPGFLAALFDDRLLTASAWDGVKDRLSYRIDGAAKVTGAKIFARDIRARDMPHWPQQQAHALVLRTTLADRLYAGFDLSMLDAELVPDRIVTAADLTRDGLAFPDFYGEDMLLPEGKTPAYLGQAVAILIFHDFARFRFAKEKLQFNGSVIRYGAVTGTLQRDPWGAERFVRIGGKTAYDEDVFSADFARII